MACVMIDVVVSGKRCKALVDSGCSQTIVSSDLCGNVSGRREIEAVDGRIIRCSGEASVIICIGESEHTVMSLIMSNMVQGVDVIIGLDLILELGGMSVTKSGVVFGNSRGSVGVACKATEVPEIPNIVIEDPDFCASFDGVKLEVIWKWKNEEPF